MGTLRGSADLTRLPLLRGVSLRFTARTRAGVVLSVWHAGTTPENNRRRLGGCAMCCCGKPVINGEAGYRWNTPDGPAGVYPVNPPALSDGDVLLYEEPGRCGGVDSHSHHYRVVARSGSAFLLVRHGGGDECVRLANGKVLLYGLALLDGARYWTLNAIYHAYAAGHREAYEAETQRWRVAAAEKRIKTRKCKRVVKVWIEPAGVAAG